MTTLLLTLLMPGLCSADPSPNARPNVVILMTDDLRRDFVGRFASFNLRTPTIDRLVDEGVTFRSAYCLGGNSPAVCLPSRNMFLTGRTYFRWLGQKYAPADGPSLPRSFNDAGYDTFHVGKHGNVAIEVEKLFGTSSYLEDDKERRSGEPGRTAVQRAIDWLKDRSADRPFLMYLAFEAPHDPRVADERFRVGYEPATMPLPANFLPEHPFDNGELRIRDEQLAGWPRTEAEVRQHLSDYAAVVTGLDYHIGQFIEHLKATGQYERTIIVFTSDHGLSIGSHGLMGKQNLYEEGMGAPLVITGPGIQPGKTDSLVYLHDIYPTLCELVGIAPPSGLDGRSLVPILRDPSAMVRGDIILAYRDVQRAMRDDRWKLIRYPKVERTQLFDLRDDPDERIDLSTEPDQAGRLRAMMSRLQSLQNEIGDDLSLNLR